MDNSTELVAVCEVYNRNDEGMTTFEEFFYIGCGIMGFMFNALVMLIALLHVDTHDRPRQIIVMNMTAADLLMCLVYMLTRPFLQHLPILFCYPYYVIICAVQLCSCFNLLWLNVDKFIFVQLPLRYYIIVDRFRLITVSILTWISIIVLVMFGYHFMSYFSMPPRCDLVSLPPFIYAPICIMYIVLICACFIISVIIFFIAQGSNRTERKAKPKLLQPLFFLFSSTLWTFFTCLPYRLLYLTTIIESHLIEDYCPSLAMMTATNFFFRVLVLGTVINPLITIVTQRIYRERLVWYTKRFRRIICIARDNRDRFARKSSSVHKFSANQPAAPLQTTSSQHMRAASGKAVWV